MRPSDEEAVRSIDLDEAGGEAVPLHLGWVWPGRYRIELRDVGAIHRVAASVEVEVTAGADLTDVELRVP